MRFLPMTPERRKNIFNACFWPAMLLWSPSGVSPGISSIWSEVFTDIICWMIRDEKKYAIKIDITGNNPPISCCVSGLRSQLLQSKQGHPDFLFHRPLFQVQTWGETWSHLKAGPEPMGPSTAQRGHIVHGLTIYGRDRRGQVQCEMVLVTVLLENNVDRLWKKHSEHQDERWLLSVSHVHHSHNVCMNNEWVQSCLTKFPMLPHAHILTKSPPAKPL